MNRREVEVKTVKKLSFGWREYLLRQRSLALLEVTPIVAMEVHAYALAALAIALVYLIYRSDAVGRYNMRRRSFRDYLYVVLPICYVIVAGLSFVLDDGQMIWVVLAFGLGPLFLREALLKGLAAHVLEENKLAEGKGG